MDVVEITQNYSYMGYYIILPKLDPFVLVMLLLGIPALSDFLFKFGKELCLVTVHEFSLPDRAIIFPD